MKPLSAAFRQNSSQYDNDSVVVVVDGSAVVVDAFVVVDVDVDGVVDVVVVVDVDVELSGIPCLQQLSVVLQMSSAMHPPIE